MLRIEQFRANKALDFDGWIAARKHGITATQVGKGDWESKPVPDNPYMAFGRDAEGPLSMWVKDVYGILPNEWLISNLDERWALATPDGISLDHESISEIKTTGKDFGEWQNVPLNYVKQVQWQMFVTGASNCVFSWMLRVKQPDGSFGFGWMEPKSVWVKRDNDMIRELVSVGQNLWKKKLAAIVAEMEGTQNG